MLEEILRTVRSTSLVVSRYKDDNQTNSKILHKSRSSGRFTLANGDDVSSLINADRESISAYREFIMNEEADKRFYEKHLSEQNRKSVSRDRVVDTDGEKNVEDA